jgi:hypothetical protein
MGMLNTPEEFREFEAGLPRGSFLAELSNNIGLIRSFASEEWTYGESRDGFWEQLEDAMQEEFSMPDPPVDTDIVEQLASRLNDYTHGDPEAFDVLVEALGSDGGLSAALPGRVESAIRTAVEVDYAELDDLLQGWSGEAARMFTRGYLAYWPLSAGLQLRFVRQVEIALRAYQLLLYKIRHGVIRIAQDTVGALSLLKGEIQDSAAAGDVSSVEQTRNNAIYGVIAAALGVPGTVSATITLVQAFQPEEPPPNDLSSSPSAFEDANASSHRDDQDRTIGGTTKYEIIQSALRALDTLNGLVDDEERDIRAAIEEVSRFSYDEGKRWLLLDPSEVLDSYSNGQNLAGYFEPMEPLGHFPDEGRLDADLVNLNEGARVILPAMAYQYEYARLILLAVSDGIDTAYGASWLFSMGSLVSLCGRLCTILGHCRDNLLAAGDSLASIARRFAEMDGFNAEQLNNTLGGGRFDDPPTYEGYEGRILGQDTPTRPELFGRYTLPSLPS